MTSMNIAVGCIQTAPYARRPQRVHVRRRPGWDDDLSGHALPLPNERRSDGRCVQQSRGAVTTDSSSETRVTPCSRITPGDTRRSTPSARPFSGPETCALRSCSCTAAPTRRYLRMQTLELAEALERLPLPYSVVIYAGDNAGCFAEPTRPGRAGHRVVPRAHGAVALATATSCQSEIGRHVHESTTAFPIARGVALVVESCMRSVHCRRRPGPAKHGSRPPSIQSGRWRCPRTGNGSPTRWRIATRPGAHINEMWIIDCRDPGKRVGSATRSRRSRCHTGRPTAKWLAYDGNDGRQSGLWVAHADGSRPVFLSRETDPNLPLPGWLGHELLVIRDPGQGDNVLVVPGQQADRVHPRHSGRQRGRQRERPGRRIALSLPSDDRQRAPLASMTTAA